MRRNPLPFLILFLALFIGIYSYTASGIGSIVQRFSAFSPGVAQLIFWMFHLLLLGLVIAGAFRVRSGRGMPVWMTLAANTLLALLVTQLVFSLVLLLGDAGRWGSSLFSASGMAERSTGLLLTGVALAAVPLLAFAHGTTRGKYRYTVKKQILYFDDLPAAFDGFTLTQISDVHAGSFTNPQAVEKGIRKVNALKSDLFVFTGDLVNNVSTEFEPWVNHFSQIKAPYGQFSIFGNHDYGDYGHWPSPEAKRANLEHLKALHARTDFRLLLDENVTIEKDGQKIYLLGIQNWGEGFSQYGDFARTLNGVPAEGFKILLSHDPTHFESQVKKHPANVQLTLSGHTHGMQFGIEIFGFKWSPVQYRYPRWAGLYEENGRYLYINRGFGFLGFSGRIGIWPEITQIVLKSR